MGLQGGGILRLHHLRGGGVPQGQPTVEHGRGQLVLHGVVHGDGRAAIKAASAQLRGPKGGQRAEMVGPVGDSCENGRKHGVLSRLTIKMLDQAGQIGMAHLHRMEGGGLGHDSGPRRG